MNVGGRREHAEAIDIEQESVTGRGLARLIQDDADRTCIRLIVLAAAVFCMILLLMPPPSEFDVVNFFKQSEALKSGLLPYKDFVFEFPPFALIFFTIPGLFTSDQNTYALLFGIMVIIAIAVAMYYVQRICGRIGINRTATTIIFIVLILIYFPVRKYDVFPMCLTIVAIFYFIERRFGLAYGLAAMATLTKIYPGLIILLFLTINLTEHRDDRLKNIAVGLISCIAIAALAFIPLLVAGVSPAEALSFLSFHSDRGFQNESLFAVFVASLSMLGLTESHIVFEHDAYDIVGPLTDAVMPYWTAITIVAILSVLFVTARYVMKRHVSEAGWNERSLIVMSLAIIMIFLLVNKVFSTQYLVWIFPMMVCIPLMCKEHLSRTIALVILIVGLSTTYLLCESNSSAFVVLNIVRDIMLISLFAMCIHSLLFPESEKAALDLG